MILVFRLLILSWLCCHSNADISKNIVNKKLPTPSLVVASSLPSESIHTHIETMYDAETTWIQLEDSGYNLALLNNKSLFFRALAAGIFVGLGVY